MRDQPGDIECEQFYLLNANLSPTDSAAPNRYTAQMFRRRKVVFKDLSIKGRVLLLTLLPTSLLALVLGGYFTWVQLSGLQTQLLQRGEMLVEHLAPLAAPALEQKDVKKLERIAQQALEHPDVRAVGFLAPERASLAHAGPSMLNPTPSGQPGVSLLSGQDATRFLLPVYDQHLVLNDTLAEDGQWSCSAGSNWSSHTREHCSAATAACSPACC